MNKFKLLVLSIVLISSTALANGAGSGFGITVGGGLPFVNQVGVNYAINDTFSLALIYNKLSVVIGEASLDLTMPELSVNYHPFSGSFYIGAGLGQEKFTATSTESTTQTEISVDVTATTTLARIGWMWGKANGGFWFGIDYTMIMPSGAEIDIDDNGLGLDATEEYQDVEDAGEQFGETAYGNITFARFGWLF